MPPSTPKEEEDGWDAVAPDVNEKPLVEEASPSNEQQSRSSGSAKRASRIPIYLGLLAATVLGGYFVVRNLGESTATHQPKSSMAAPVVAPEPKPISPANEQASPTEAPRELAQDPESSPPQPEPDANSEKHEDVASSPPSDSGSLVTVLVKTVPPNARFFYKGKPIGRAPLTVELKPGERRAFELGHPGFYPRKVVVDGKRKEMTVAMRPQK